MSIVDDIGLSLVQKLPPELAHKVTIHALQSGLASKAKPMPPAKLELLKTNWPISRFALTNPLGIAPGFDKNAQVFKACLAMGCGSVECGTVTPEPQAGNPKPRLFRLPEDNGVVNRMGFNNDGLSAFAKKLEKNTPSSGVVGANVGANKTSEGEKRIEDYEKGIRAVWQHSSYLTLNISSPNTPGLRGLQNKADLEDLLRVASNTIADMENTHGVERPVFLKIAPDVDDEAIKDIVDALIAANGMTGIVVSNTTIERPETLKSSNAEQAGGLSGAPLFEKSTEVLKQVARHADGRLDIIGVGGIDSAETAYAKIRAGAHSLQLYSALIYSGAGLVQEILYGLCDLLEKDGFSHINQAIGADL